VKDKQQKLSYAQIAKKYNIGVATVKRFVCEAKNGVIAPKTPDRKGTKNPNAKVTEGYKNELIELLQVSNDLTDSEIIDELHETTNITLSPSGMSRLRRRMGITIKQKTLLYESRDNPIHQAQNEQFLKDHHRTHGTIKLNTCMSTDEAGFKSTINRKHAKSKILKTKNQYFLAAGIRQVAGGSYKANRSRAYGKTQKHASFKFNIILTISLDPDIPIVAYQIQDEYFNSEHFTSFIVKINAPPNHTHDLIDRASFHRSSTLVGNQVITPKEAYDYENITRDWIPTGWPQYNPVEQAFGWIKQFCENRAPRFHNGEGWNKNHLKYVVKLAINNITHNLVKGWYRNSYQHMYPHLQIPVYLR
jgi:transposase